MPDGRQHADCCTRPGVEDNVASAVVDRGGAVLEPEDVADAVVAALRDERFLILPHPEVLDVLPAQGQRLRPLDRRHAPPAEDRQRL